MTALPCIARVMYGTSWGRDFRSPRRPPALAAQQLRLPHPEP